MIVSRTLTEVHQKHVELNERHHRVLMVSATVFMICGILLGYYELHSLGMALEIGGLLYIASIG